MRKMILIALMLLPGCDFQVFRNYNRKYVTVCSLWTWRLNSIVNDYLDHGYEVFERSHTDRSGESCQTLIKGCVMRYDVQNMEK